ncbi:MAG: hypothetical protein WCC60_01935, partial [Ilumatobacteraceae bacterium]
PSDVAEAITPIAGDWNGDGVEDSAVSWREPNGPSSLWFVRSEMAGGPASSVALGDLGVGFLALMDNIDVDFALGAPAGTNRDEMLAIVGVSSSGYNLGVFGVGVDGCLFQFDDGAGSPFIMSVAGAVSQMSGVRCDGGAGSQFIVQLQAITFDGMNWATTDRRIDRAGATSLVPGTELPGILAGTDPLLLLYGQATCGGQVYLDEGSDRGAGDF